MDNLAGRTAFITGGASGIGLALGQACAQAGMNVALADIEAPALEQAVAGLARSGGKARAVVCDVADRASVQRAAQQAIAAFGKVHLLCNNAGVSSGGLVEEIAPADWEWVLGVNLMGVVHGLQAFLPHLKAHGEPAHIVNTASMAGTLGGPFMAPYCASKFAVIGLSESLAEELKGTPIGVSVLCPGWVRTHILESGRNRPAALGGPFQLEAQGPTEERSAAFIAAVRNFVQNGMDPGEVAGRVLRAIREREFYVFTHLDFRALIEERHRRLQAAYERAAQPLAPPPRAR